MTSRRNRVFALLLLLAFSGFGCSDALHNLQPHRLKKLNSGPAPSLSPDFTDRSPSQPTGLVRWDRPPKPARLTANSAELSLARGQNLK